MAAFETGLKLHRAGKRREAVSFYQKALQQDPHDHRALYWLGILNYQHGDVTRAQNHMQKAVELAPDTAEYRLGYGRFLQETGRPARAVKHLRAALKFGPDNAKARYRLAMVLHRTGEHDEALGHYRALAADQENNPTLMVNMGTLLSLMGRSEDAIPLLQRAIELSPSLASAHGNLGNAFAAVRRFDEAIAAFEACLKLQPGQPKIYAKLGSCELARGNLDAARAAYERCLRVTPGDVTSLAMLAAIHNEQENPEPALALLDYDAMIHTSVIDAGAGGFEQQAFLAAVRKHVLSHPTLKADPGSHTRSGKQTGSLWPSDDDTMRLLAGFIDKQIRAYRANRPEHWQPLEALPPLWPPPKDWRIDMRGIVLGEGGHQTSHLHPAGWLSGVYYIDVPPPDDGPDRHGCIEYGCLPENVPLGALPVVHRHQPRAGELVLYPSYFFTRTTALGNDGFLIGIAFDVIPA